MAAPRLTGRRPLAAMTATSPSRSCLLERIRGCDGTAAWRHGPTQAPGSADTKVRPAMRCPRLADGWRRTKRGIISGRGQLGQVGHILVRQPEPRGHADVSGRNAGAGQSPTTSPLSRSRTASRPSVWAMRAGKPRRRNEAFGRHRPSSAMPGSGPMAGLRRRIGSTPNPQPQSFRVPPTAAARRRPGHAGATALRHRGEGRGGPRPGTRPRRSELRFAHLLDHHAVADRIAVGSISPIQERGPIRRRRDRP